MSKSVKNKMQDQSTTPFEGGKDVLELDAEDMGSTHITEVSIAVKEVVNGEVIRLDPYEKRIQDFREKYAGLVIVDVDDRDGIEAVTLAVRDMRTVRVNTGKEKAAAKAPFWDACKFLESKADFIQKEISKIEDPLKARLDEIKSEKEAIQAEKKRKADEQLMIRQQTLTKLGAEYVDGNFNLGDISFESSMIRESDEDIWTSDILPLYQAHYDKVEADKAEVKRLADQANADLEKQKKELADAQKLLLDQQAELKRQLDEQAKKDEEVRIQKRKAMIDFRTAKCQDLGMHYDFKNQRFYFGELYIPVGRASDSGEGELTDTEFDELVKQVEPQIVEQKRLADEKAVEKLKAQELLQEQAATGRARKSFLNSLGVNYGTIESLGVIPADEWEGLQKGYQDTYNTQQAEKAEMLRKENEQKEKDRQQTITDGLNDKGKLEAFRIDVMKLVVPTFKSGQYKKVGIALQDKIDAMLALKAEITNQYSK